MALEEEGEGEEGVHGRKGGNEGGGERLRGGEEPPSLRTPAQNVLYGERLRQLPPLFTLHFCKMIK